MIGLEQLMDGTAAARNFERLDRLVIDTGGLSVSVRWGTSTATWTAARDAADKTIAHSLARVPVFVRCTSRTVTIEYAQISEDATNFVVRGYHTDGTALTGTFAFFWLAIG